ncbi:hypothetical protein [Leifsonia sp. WHRI 6310E]|uniref:hypothetical protein n=1 Tax=Leifsonia sp. WHRI 6310E TaxID=3162562 RepID=UPI0032FAB8DB
MKRTTDSVLLPDATSCSVASNDRSLSTARPPSWTSNPLRGRRNIAEYSTKDVPDAAVELIDPRDTPVTEFTPPFRYALALLDGQ